MLNKGSTITVRNEKRKENGIDYNYRLTVEESERVASYTLPLYTISVEMKESDGTVTNATARELFSDAGKARLFFDKLVNNLATPVDLPYIVEDELSG